MEKTDEYIKPSAREKEDVISGKASKSTNLNNKTDTGKSYKGENIMADSKKGKKEVLKAEEVPADNSDDKCPDCGEPMKECKCASKGEGNSQNPEEASTASDSAGNSTSPGMGVPSTQNVFVPQSNVNVAREQSTPMDGMHKEIDFTKSPLFLKMSDKFDELQKVMASKLEAVEKSVNDRLKNLKSDMEKAEKFYGQSFYKATSEGVGPEGLKQNTISKQIEDGKVRYRN